MKTKILALLLAVLVTASLIPSLGVATYVNPYDVVLANRGITFGATTASGVNVRRTPRSNGQIVTTIRNSGTPLIIVGSEVAAKVTYYIVVIDGERAYIRADLLSPITVDAYTAVAGTVELYDLLSDTGVDVSLLPTVAPRDSWGSVTAQSTARPTAKPTKTAQAAARPQVTPEPYILAAGSSSSSQMYDTAPVQQVQQQVTYVYKSETGSKYHTINNCGNMNPNKATRITLDQAKGSGLTACTNCGAAR